MRTYYTTFEAAKLLGVSLPTVVNWIKARRLKAHRTPGGHRRIAREELAAFMVRHGMPVPDELSGVAPARRKVLVIGPPGPVREGAARQLAAVGYAVEQSSAGFAAGSTAARFGPDAFVLHAESEDGGQPLRDLLADRDLAGTPVVALGRAAWEQELRAAGCAAAVSGSGANGALVTAVQQALSAAPPKGSPRAPAPRPPRARRRRSGGRTGGD